jgi:hypothetical protein
MPTTMEKWKVQPHDPPVHLTDGVLTVTGEIVMPLGRFPRRMTVARLSGGRSAVWSAIALEDAGMAEVEAMGRPAFLIVPSDHHRLDAKVWLERYPDMQVIAPPGAREGVEEAVPVDAVHDVMGDPQVRFVVVPGMALHESALEIRRDGELTLVTNDVIANVAHPHGLGANIMARLFGFGVSEPQVPRPVKPKDVIDRAALARQFRAWADETGLRRIVMSHGDVIEDKPAEVLRALAESLD